MTKKTGLISKVTFHKLHYEKVVELGCNHWGHGDPAPDLLLVYTALDPSPIELLLAV